MAEYKGAASEAGRAAMILKDRERKKQDFEAQKDKIRKEAKANLADIKSKFESTVDWASSKMTQSTIGLKRLEDFKMTREKIEAEKEAMDRAAKEDEERRRKEEKKKRQKEREKKTKLSFNFADGDEDGEEQEDDMDEPEKKKPKKDPTVDTSFLPDREREQKEAELRKQLAAEWQGKQEKIKQEIIRITYSYWDGAGHRREIEVRKGNSIREFLQKSLETLRKEFLDLRTIGVDSLMYIKEDLIIPQHFTFYDFIVNKARGKTGPLFKFDAQEDVRLVSDATVEKDETHAGKIVTRSWYERNKHIFPASRWEIYDPDKDYGKYSFGDRTKKKQ